MRSLQQNLVDHKSISSATLYFIPAAHHDDHVPSLFIKWSSNKANYSCKNTL